VTAGPGEFVGEVGPKLEDVGDGEGAVVAAGFNFDFEVLDVAAGGEISEKDRGRLVSGLRETWGHIWRWLGRCDGGTGG
jgi:hypothetical protein